MIDKTEILDKVSKLADEITERRQLMEMLTMKLFTEEQWRKDILPRFNEIRIALSDIIATIFLNNRSNQNEGTQIREERSIKR